MEGRAPGVHKGQVDIPVGEDKDDEGSWAPSHEVDCCLYCTSFADLCLVVDSHGYGKQMYQVCRSHPMSTASSSVG